MIIIIIIAYILHVLIGLIQLPSKFKEKKNSNIYVYVHLRLKISFSNTLKNDVHLLY